MQSCVIMDATYIKEYGLVKVFPAIIDLFHVKNEFKKHTSMLKKKRKKQHAY